MSRAAQQSWVVFQEQQHDVLDHLSGTLMSTYAVHIIHDERLGELVKCEYRVPTALICFIIR